MTSTVSESKSTGELNSVVAKIDFAFASTCVLQIIRNDLECVSKLVKVAKNNASNFVRLKEPFVRIY